MNDHPMTVEVRTFVIIGEESVPVERCGLSFTRDDRVQGAIELPVNGVPILGRDEIDTIDALWSLLLTYLDRFAADGEEVFNFPERRWALNLKRVSGARVLVTFENGLDRRRAVASEKSVVCGLAAGAVRFFGAVLNFAPKEEWSYRRDFNLAMKMRARYSWVRAEGRTGDAGFVVDHTASDTCTSVLSDLARQSAATALNLNARTPPDPDETSTPSRGVHLRGRLAGDRRRSVIVSLGLPVLYSS
ncbi:hypothetical protein ACIBI3_12400 [Actinomadura luteofluorescens]|uniref:hypothetical protein n=1 Tax=Actinomadura luteofluorescens TaxID=46163 RepID=UPI003470A9E1